MITSNVLVFEKPEKKESAPSVPAMGNAF